MRRLLASVALVLAPTIVAAQSALPASPYANIQLADAGKEAKARSLMNAIRCMVCDGQSIADSDAELAGDMRSLIRERIAAGEDPDAVRRWLVQRYGQEISYAPPFEGATLVLWLAPLALLGIGAAMASSRFRRRRR